MPPVNSGDKMSFLYPYNRFRGQFTPQNLVFNVNLQEFAKKVEYLCALHTNGKLSNEHIYRELKLLWNQLEQNGGEVRIEDS